MKTISSYRTTSVYFKYNGKYFLFVCDNYSFYYLGDKKIKNKFYFQLFWLFIINNSTFILKRFDFLDKCAILL
jgi:hypothetical protein